MRGKTEKEMEKSIWSRKIFVCMGEEKQKMKKRKIFGKRNFFLRRRIKAEKKREECIWSKKRFLTGENKSGEEKKGK